MNIEDKELEQFRKSQRRKDIIKNIIIVFLLILLALTLFSRTIMNLTLPEVATHVVAEGEVSPKIRGQGTAEVDNPYSVTIAQSRTIKSVAVREGQVVKRGDVIYHLEDTESEELKTAKQELEDAKASFTRRIFDGTLSDSDITRLRAGNYRSEDELQSAVGSINRQYESALREKNLATAEYDRINAEYQAEAEKEANNNNDTYYYPEEPENGGGAEASNGTGSVAQAAVEADKSKGISAASAGSKEVDEEDLVVVSSSGSTTSKKVKKLAKKLEKATLRKLEADLKFEEISAEREKILNIVSAELDLKGYQEAINKAQAKVDKLQKEEIGASITSPVDGTVTSLNVGAGEITSADSPVAIIRINGKKLTVSFSVTKEQAQKLKAGDEAAPQNAWEYDDTFKAVLRQITADSSDPQNSRLLKFEIESDTVTAGDIVKLQIAETSKDYELVVPNSAIRNDANGNFVLLLRTKQSPLGNRYYVSRENVKVLAKDDTNSAISGALGAYDYVVTTSDNKMLTSGDQVRLSNEVDPDE